MVGVGELWERIREAVGYRSGEDKQAEAVTEFLARRQQEIREQWATDLMAKRETEADLYAKYEAQIEGLNQIALEIHDRYYTGKISIKTLPEIVHPEGVREAIRTLGQPEEYIGGYHKTRERLVRAYGQQWLANGTKWTYRDARKAIQAIAHNENRFIAKAHGMHAESGEIGKYEGVEFRHGARRAVLDWSHDGNHKMKLAEEYAAKRAAHAAKLPGASVGVSL